MTTYTQLVQRLREIKDMGYVRTHRAGPTGIGKTLEDLMGIKENNVPGPNAAMVELKSERKNASNMVTLFTKSPLPRGANSALLERHGYESAVGNRRKKLHTTVNARTYNQLRGKPGLKIDVGKSQISLIDAKNEVLGHWDRETLRNSFEKKLRKLLYVKADARGCGAEEEFWFNEAWFLSGFNFDSFVNLMRKTIILVDIRMGQYPDGRPHDHGTAFRVFPDQLDVCFGHRKTIV